MSNKQARLDELNGRLARLWREYHLTMPNLDEHMATITATLAELKALEAS